MVRGGSQSARSDRCGNGDEPEYRSRPRRGGNSLKYRRQGINTTSQDKSIAGRPHVPDLPRTPSLTRRKIVFESQCSSMDVRPTKHDRFVCKCVQRCESHEKPFAQAIGLFECSESSRAAHPCTDVNNMLTSIMGAGTQNNSLLIGGLFS